MIAFVTTRQSALEIKRRLHNFANLGVPVRHFHFAKESHPEIFRALSGRRIGARLWDLSTGTIRLRRILRTLTEGDIVFVNALDALVATIVAGTGLSVRAPLACQILDAHPLLLHAGPYRPLLRAVERWALSHVDLLIVPNAGNITRYYGPVVGYRGASAVVHNTLPTDEAANPGPPPAFEGVWIVGWFGSLRCEKTLEILCSVADALGDRVEIRMAGVTKMPPGRLEAAIEPYANIRYSGPFEAAQDASRLYSGVHIACGLHFEPPEKSKWALPVRILEAGAYGRPAVARGDADAGEFVRSHRIGWALDAPTAESFIELLAGLTADTYQRVTENVAAQPRLFIGEDHLQAALARLGHGA